MPKSYKAFVKEYSMGLQVPSTSYLKGVGSLNKLTKKEMSSMNTAGGDETPAPILTLKKKEDIIPQGEMKPLKRKDEVSTKLKAKVLDRKISRFKKKFRQNLKDRKP